MLSKVATKHTCQQCGKQYNTAKKVSRELCHACADKAHHERMKHLIEAQKFIKERKHAKQSS
ncbi:hypothetical protein [Kingella negevensis]|uniref:hypothetical protein n=1 Tax=Kingella negevensis TaxID=1522312 RepID=UPI000A269A75|nr:hypothetical protein [Kingella negevensis]WII91724.1 hypothetical protein QEO93_03845 [Kingella negevensis]